MITLQDSVNCVICTSLVSAPRPKAYLSSTFFSRPLGDDAVSDDYSSIAMYFENQKHHFLAGKFFLKSAQYAKVTLKPKRRGR